MNLTPRSSVPAFRFAALLAMLTFVAPSIAEDEPTETGEQRAARLLDAMGGAQAWAAVEVLIVEATHQSMSAPTTYANRIVNDLTQPRVKFEGHAPGWDRWATIDGDVGMYRRDMEAIVERSADRVAADAQWWETNIYRTLRQLALGDPTLKLEAVDEDRLKISNEVGPLNWFRINADGAPVLFGSGENETGTIMGPLTTHESGVRYPIWGAGDAGAFRYQIDQFIVNPEVTDELFAIPPPE